MVAQGSHFGSKLRAGDNGSNFDLNFRFFISIWSSGFSFLFGVHVRHYLTMVQLGGNVQGSRFDLELRVQLGGNLIGNSFASKK